MATSNSVSAASSSSVASMQVKVIAVDKTEAKISPSIASLEKAALTEDLDAQVRLGRAYFNGNEGIAKDLVAATKWFKLAAQQQKDTPAGQYAQGRCYHYGLDVKKDEKEAVRLYRLAAEQGDARAQSNLGECYERGNGVAKNLDEAIRLYALAASQGIQEAQAALNSIQAKAQHSWCRLQ